MNVSKFTRDKYVSSLSTGKSKGRKLTLPPLETQECLHMGSRTCSVVVWTYLLEWKLDWECLLN